MENTTYEGWKNRATWNCALWIRNNYSIYTAACKFMKTYTGKSPYSAFIKSAGMESDCTPDRFAWLGTKLCYSELNDMMREFAPEGSRA